MGDSNRASAKRIIRSGANTAAASAVKAAFTREGTVKKGASKAVVQRAQAVLRQSRNRKVAGRTTRRTNAAARAAAIPLARNQTRQRLNARIRSGD